jgi:hypothetical protein
VADAACCTDSRSSHSSTALRWQPMH